MIMKLKKKIILIANVMLCAALFCACGKVEENQKDSNGKWEDAYKEIVRNMESYLADPYILRQEQERADNDSCIGYIGIHDFDDDSVPELIIGDDVSVGIFTYYNGSVKKIADLYEPEDWGCINGVHYKDNTVILINSGSDGSCYVCLSCHDGEYITGVFDEYNPETAIVNGKEGTEEEFKMWFDLAGLLDSSSIPRSRIKKDNGIVTAFVINVFQKSDEYIPVEDLDFNAVEW